MKYSVVELPKLTVAGIKTRTSNDSPECTADIGNLWKCFMDAGMAKSVPGAVEDPYTCFALYYNYDLSSNDYDLLIGCQIENDGINPGVDSESRVIPAGRYAKIEIRGGDCVDSVQGAWADIWTDEELMAQRSFTVDFEAYLPGEDMSCADIDIYVALK